MIDPIGEFRSLVNADGTPTPEFVQWLADLAAYINALEARIAALEP